MAAPWELVIVRAGAVNSGRAVIAAIIIVVHDVAVSVPTCLDVIVVARPSSSVNRVEGIEVRVAVVVAEWLG